MSEPDFKFEFRRLADRSDTALVAEMRRVAELIPEQVITGEAFAPLSRVHRTTLARRFGSWESAWTAAGLQDRLHPKAIHKSDDQLLDEMRKLAKSLNKDHLTVREVEERLQIGMRQIKRRWGSARKALEAAGLSTTAVGMRFSDDERFENLLIVWTHYGRPPTYREMSAAPSKIGAKAYRLRYGSWNAALAAFVERANSTVEVERQSRAETTLPPTDKRRERGPRDVPLGLRFKILQRDRFRCVLCGTSPPTDPSCVLHVDHVVPWSLGGETIAENLRALCSTCNVGRSNRSTTDERLQS